MSASSTGRGFPDYLNAASLPLWNYAELILRMEHVVMMGVIARADYDAGKARVLVSEKVVTEWLPWLPARAGADVVWDAPDIGETVMVISPAGNPNNGFILPGSNKRAVKHQSNTPDVSKRIWRVRKRKGTDSAAVDDSPEAVRALSDQLRAEPEIEDIGVKYAHNPLITRIYEFNRRKARNRDRLADTGHWCWEVHDLARIFADKDKIELRVGDGDAENDTKLVITRDDVAIYVKGQRAAFMLTETRAALRVNDNKVTQEWNGDDASVTTRVGQEKEGTTTRLTKKSCEVNVQGKGVLILKANSFDVELKEQKARLLLNELSAGIRFGESEALFNRPTKADEPAWSLIMPGSTLAMTSTVVTVLSPLVLINGAPFEGEPTPPAIYEAGPKPQTDFAPLEVPIPEVELEPFTEGSEPYMPEN